MLLRLEAGIKIGNKFREFKMHLWQLIILNTLNITRFLYGYLAFCIKLYFILAAQFESLTQPIIVLLEIPIDIAGAL